MSVPIRRLAALQRHVFLLNSRLGLFTAPPVSPPGGSFSRSYGSNLPSSLAMILSSTLGYSPHPPVSVWVRAPPADYDAFLGSGLTSTISLPVGSEYCRGSAWWPADLPAGRPTPFNARPSGRGSVTSASRLSLALEGGTGIFNRFAIVYALRLRLRSRLTLIRLALIRNPWVFGGRVFHPSCRYSCLQFRFQKFHGVSQLRFSTAGMLPYR